MCVWVRMSDRSLSCFDSKSIIHEKLHKLFSKNSCLFKGYNSRAKYTHQRLIASTCNSCVFLVCNSSIKYTSYLQWLHYIILIPYFGIYMFQYLTYNDYALNNLYIKNLCYGFWKSARYHYQIHSNNIQKVSFYTYNTNKCTIQCADFHSALLKHSNELFEIHKLCITFV